MRRLILGLFLVLMMAPGVMVAESPPISRRDGFLLIWNSIRRPVLENREKPFTDVAKDSQGFAEITYAKYRGILDDDQTEFRPDEQLTTDQALLWIFRTRSIDEEPLYPDVYVDGGSDPYGVSWTARKLGLSEYVTDHPEGEPTVSRDPVSEEKLTEMMRSIDQLLSEQVHEVSLYSEKFHGKGTAFGETFDMHAMTAAHRTFPHNTLVKVTNIANGKSVTVRINDRGPFVKGRDMDLSLGAFTTIEDRSRGILRATFQRLGDATLVGQCSGTDQRRAIRITKNVRLIGGVPMTLPLGKDLTFHSTRPFLLLSVRYPDGNITYLEDWILPGESHPFTPGVEGEYLFTLGSVEGRRREVRMGVVRCQEDSTSSHTGSNG